MVRLVGSPVSWSPAGHCAVVAGPREEREERDDRRGRPVSERAGEGESARERDARPGVAGPSVSERGRARMCVGGPRVLLGRAREKKRESARATDFVFLFKKCE
jgi:hypothetical protein